MRERGLFRVVICNLIFSSVAITAENWIGSSMKEYHKISMTLDEVAAYKRAITCNAEFSDRISVGFAIRLEIQRAAHGDEHHVLWEIEHLEKGIETTTKPASQFKFPPLHPFWHKHFSSYRHTLRNIGERWNVSRGGGNRDLKAMIDRVADECGRDPDLWPKKIAHDCIIGALEERSADRRMSGDWIIFAKYNGQNYYLDLATHEEGLPGGPAEHLYERLKQGSSAEFPFLFESE